MIDWNIRFGDILVVASLAGTAVVFAYKTGAFTESVEAMKKEMSELKDIAKTIGTVLQTLAVQKSEIMHIQEDIREMKHLKGFIVNNPKIIDKDRD